MANTDNEGARQYAQPRHRNKPTNGEPTPPENEAAPRRRATEQNDGFSDETDTLETPAIEPEASGGKWHPSTNTPAQQQPEMTSEQRIAAAIDVATKDSVDKINGLIEQLNGMRAFVESDAERIKGELLGHIGVRDKANELVASVKSEMEIMGKRVGHDQ